jgi:hypothetical protein
MLNENLFLAARQIVAWGGVKASESHNGTRTAQEYEDAEDLLKQLLREWAKREQRKGAEA